MSTLGETLDELEDRDFTGRTRELRILREWLCTFHELPQVLDVTGPAGIGKSALLRTFQRGALREGRPVLRVDARALGRSPLALLRALGGDDLDAVVRRLNELRPLLVFDSFDEAAGLANYCLESLVPCLDTDVRVVVAGRHPIAEIDPAAPWARLIRPLRLEGLSFQDSRTYLARRGATDSRVVQQVWGVTRGYPLGLSLAADAVVHLGVRDFSNASERRVIVRSLVETLMREVADPVVRELLDVFAVVREVDETSLAVLSGRADVGAAFDQVSRLSIVRPARHGLTLLEQVRVLLSDDLRWRRPDRHRELCRRASVLVRERIGSAAPSDREWLMAERLRLLDTAGFAATAHPDPEAEQVWLECGEETDHAAFSSLPISWRSGTGVEDAEVPGPEQREHLHAWMALDGQRLRIVRNETGSVVAGSLAVPLCRPTIATVLADPTLSPALRRYWSARQLTDLPRTAEGATDFYLLDLRYAAEATEAVAHVLWQDLLALFARGGVYFARTSGNDVGAASQLQAVGFRPLPVGERTDGVVARVHALDVTQIGLIAWQDLVLSPRRPPVPVTSTELVAELRLLLPQWQYDAVLARSSLAALADIAPDASEAEAAEAARRLTGAVLARARVANPESSLAYQALELAYLTRIGSHERVAERLAVSRSTLYRLLRRAEEGLSCALLSSLPLVLQGHPRPTSSPGSVR
jgi:hypothetical protein